MRLERFTENDRPLYEQLVFNATVMGMNLGRVFSEEEAGMFFSAMLEQNAAGTDLGYYKVYIGSDLDEAYIGMGALTFSEGYSAVEIEYMLLPDYWDFGYGTQLVEILTAMSESSGLSSETVAITDPENWRSRNVLIRNGFVSDGVFINGDGEPAELFVKPIS